MNLLLAFSPFLVFAITNRVIGSLEGLLTGAGVSALLVLRDWISPNRTAKILEIGSFILFGGLSIYTLLADPKWSIVGARLCVDSGILVIVLFSLAIRRPFTSPYAREQVSRESWDSPELVRTNYIISAIWALAFVVLITADLLLFYVPSLPSRIGIIVTVVVLVGAFQFTEWYPEQKRVKVAE